MDNEITNQRMTELFCANLREVREGTSAVGQVSSSNSRLPSQVLTAPTPLDINLDNEITIKSQDDGALLCQPPGGEGGH